MANATNTSANRYKGNDLDVDGDGRVGKADHASNASNADAVDGQNPLRHGEEVDAPADAHHERPQPGANISEDSDGNWNVESTGITSRPISETADGSNYETDSSLKQIHKSFSVDSGLVLEARVACTGDGSAYVVAGVDINYEDGRTYTISIDAINESRTLASYGQPDEWYSTNRVESIDLYLKQDAELAPYEWEIQLLEGL